MAFSIEGLPEGLTVVTGIANPEEKPLLFNGGKMERYTPKTQKTCSSCQHLRTCLR